MWIHTRSSVYWVIQCVWWSCSRDRASFICGWIELRSLKYLRSFKRLRRGQRFFGSNLLWHEWVTFQMLFPTESKNIQPQTKKSVYNSAVKITCNYFFVLVHDTEIKPSLGCLYLFPIHVFTGGLSEEKERGKKMIESHEVILVDNFIFNIKLILSLY